MITSSPIQQESITIQNSYNDDSFISNIRPLNMKNDKNGLNGSQRKGFKVFKKYNVNSVSSTNFLKDGTDSFFDTSFQQSEHKGYFKGKMQQKHLNDFAFLDQFNSNSAQLFRQNKSQRDHSIDNEIEQLSQYLTYHQNIQPNQNILNLSMSHLNVQQSAEFGGNLVNQIAKFNQEHHHNPILHKIIQQNDQTKQNNEFDSSSNTQQKAQSRLSPFKVQEQRSVEDLAQTKDKITIFGQYGLEKHDNYNDNISTIDASCLEWKKLDSSLWDQMGESNINDKNSMQNFNNSPTNQNQMSQCKCHQQETIITIISRLEHIERKVELLTQTINHKRSTQMNDSNQINLSNLENSTQINLSNLEKSTQINVSNLKRRTQINERDTQTNVSSNTQFDKQNLSQITENHKVFDHSILQMNQNIQKMACSENIVDETIELQKQINSPLKYFMDNCEGIKKKVYFLGEQMKEEESREDNYFKIINGRLQKIDEQFSKKIDQSSLSFDLSFIYKQKQRIDTLQEQFSRLLQVSKESVQKIISFDQFTQQIENIKNTQHSLISIIANLSKLTQFS